MATASSAVKVPPSNPHEFPRFEKLWVCSHRAGARDASGVVCPAASLTFVRRRKDLLLETACSLFRCPSGKFIRPDKADIRLCEAFRGKAGKRNWIGDTTLKETGLIHPINKRCQNTGFYYLTNVSCKEKQLGMCAVGTPGSRIRKLEEGATKQGSLHGNKAKCCPC